MTVANILQLIIVYTLFYRLVNLDSLHIHLGHSDKDCTVVKSLRTDLLNSSDFKECMNNFLSPDGKVCFIDTADFKLIFTLEADTCFGNVDNVDYNLI